MYVFSFRFTIRMATPANSRMTTPRSNSLLDGRIHENQCTWADRELLYLQRGPLLANDTRYWINQSSLSSFLFHRHHACLSRQLNFPPKSNGIISSKSFPLAVKNSKYIEFILDFMDLLLAERSARDSRNLCGTLHDAYATPQWIVLPFFCACEN